MVSNEIKPAMIFRDRIEAGKLLAAKLKKYKNDSGLIMAVPRGGLPVAYVVAIELGFPIDLILTKKIGHPVYKEYAIGSVSLTDHFVLSYDNVTQEYIDHEVQRIQTMLKEMYTRYMGNKEPENATGKTMIVIDDGIATGNNLLGTIHMLRQRKPVKIVIGVPVASQDAVYELSKEVDEVVTVHIPDKFCGVGGYYDDFEEVSDDEVMYYLDKLRELSKVV